MLPMVALLLQLQLRTWWWWWGGGLLVVACAVAVVSAAIFVIDVVLPPLHIIQSTCTHPTRVQVSLFLHLRNASRGHSSSGVACFKRLPSPRDQHALPFLYTASPHHRLTYLTAVPNPPPCRACRPGPSTPSPFLPSRPSTLGLAFRRNQNKQKTPSSSRSPS